jgi:hypothetical protein
VGRDGRLNQEQTTGVLYILVDGVERRVFFKWGFVLFASSGLPADRLDDRLLNEGKVSASTLEQAYARQKSTGSRFGECLVRRRGLRRPPWAVERQSRRHHILVLHLAGRHFRREEPLDGDLMLDADQQILLGRIRSVPILLLNRGGAHDRRVRLEGRRARTPG